MEALGLDAEEGETTPRASARDAKVENALDVLFSDPIFDEDETESEGRTDGSVDVLRPCSK